MGLFEELRLKDETLTLGSGDTLVAYTDGLTDAVNDRDEQYSDSRLAGTINNAPVTAQEILTHILQDLEAFAGSAPRPDDITLLILTAD
jgi:phosphoserine phosphatase RsbU/P